VIYDPNDPNKHLYDVDNENTVLTIADWYHTAAQFLLTVPGLPVPDATLFNGLGRFAGGPNSSLAVINVNPQTRYRIRLVSMACHPNYNFSIDSHTMTIIEADGQYTQPYTVDQIQLFAGQRYSFVLTANQATSNYWIRAVPNIGADTTDGGVNSAILRYAGAADTEPTTTSGSFNAVFAENNLHALQNPAAPGKPGVGNADVNINLDFSINLQDELFSINNSTWEDPKSPVLLQILSGAVDPAKLLPNGSVISLPPNKVIEISLPALELLGAPHPFHLHGVSDYTDSRNHSS
jgi:iron transport multicopper oxidase